MQKQSEVVKKNKDGKKKMRLRTQKEDIPRKEKKVPT